MVAAATGKGFTTAIVESIAVHPTVLVITTVYKPPELSFVTSEGFCKLEVNPLGPLHEYAASRLEVRFKVEPEHTGPLFEAVPAGSGNTITLAEPVPTQPLASVTVTV